jgi:cellobiose-specific phosphotransferase system component IIC
MQLGTMFGFMLPLLLWYASTFFWYFALHGWNVKNTIYNSVFSKRKISYRVSNL